MTTKKRFMAVLIAMVMLLSAFPVTVFAATKAPAKPKSLSSTVAATSVTVKWGKVSKANGYVVYSYDTKTKKYKKIGTTSKTKYTVKKLKSATTYVYAVKSYKTVKKKKYYSGYSPKLTTSTAPDKVKNVTISNLGNTVFTVNWSAVTRASKYKLQYSDNANFAANVNTITTTAKSQTVNSLLPGTTYYVRVYAQRTANKKTYTSASSTVMTVSTTGSSAPAQPGSTPAPTPVVDRFESTKSTVNESISYQSVDGFGASAAWWSQRVGGWANADEYLKLLYSKDEGIGLNIYRYNVGAGSNSSTGTDSGLGRDRGAETFLACENDPTEITESSFDWTRDANSQKCLALAKKYAGDDLQVELFANSPAKQLTINHKAYCSFNGDDFNDHWTASFEYEYINNPPSGKNENLDEKNYGLYFDYLTAIADHFVDQGYNVTQVSPINEPNFSWAEGITYATAWGESVYADGSKGWEDKYRDAQGNFISEKSNDQVDNDPELASQKIRAFGQEGCFYSPYSARLLFKTFAEKVNEKEQATNKKLSYKIALLEGSAADVRVDSNGNFTNINAHYNHEGAFARYITEIFREPVSQKYYKSVNLHSYWSYRSDKENTFSFLQAKYPDVSVACTEYCQMNSDLANGIVAEGPNILDENGNFLAQTFYYKDGVKAAGENDNCLGIVPGVQVAREIYDNMTALNATEWNWWTAVSSGVGPDGLIYYDGEYIWKNWQTISEWDNQAKDVTTSKRLWCIGNYSRYIQSGAKRVEIKEAQSDLLSTAYKNPDGSLVIVYVNQTDANTLVNVSANGYSTYSAYETSAIHTLDCTQKGNYSYETSISIPSQSVVTVVLK